MSFKPKTYQEALAKVKTKRFKRSVKPKKVSKKRLKVKKVSVSKLHKLVWKVNFPTKAVFRMAKATDSTVMLDTGGAEKLLGKGDMLFSSDLGLERLQGYAIN